MYLIYLLFGIGTSIKPFLEITSEQAKNILSFEWSICSIMIASLITWCVLVKKNMINVKKIAAKKNKNYLRKNTAEYYLWNITPTILSFLLLISISGAIYVENILNWTLQMILYLNFYLITYSIFLIVVDIITPTIVSIFIESLETSDEKKIKISKKLKSKQKPQN